MVGNKIHVHTIPISFMFFRRKKNKIKDLVSKLEPMDLDKFLEVEGLSGRIAPDKLRYSDGNPVSCLNFAEVQLLTRELSRDNGIKIRLPTIKEDYTAFKRLDDKYREKALSPPVEWKAEYVDGSFIFINPEVRKTNHPREYEFHGPLMIYRHFAPSHFNEEVLGGMYWLGSNMDKYERAALVRGYFPGKNGKTYAAGMISPLSRDCIGLRLFVEE